MFNQYYMSDCHDTEHRQQLMNTISKVFTHDFSCPGVV